MNAAAEGEKALADSNASLAIQHYTRALTELPRAPSYYIQRAIARSRVKPADGGPQSSAALRDAEIALVLAKERGKRELILQAQMRRGVALFQLERYADAAFIFGIVESKTSKGQDTSTNEGGAKAAMATMAGGSAASKKDGVTAELPIWIAKVRRKLAGLQDGDEKLPISVSESPSGVHIPSEAELRAEWQALKSGQASATEGQTAQAGSQKEDGAPNTAASQPGILNQAPKPPAQAPSVQKVRHEWYQSQDSVVVTLYVKGVPKDTVELELQETSVSLQFPLATGTTYDFTLHPLYAPIDEASSTVSVMGTKIELTLKKKTHGQKWNALEGQASETSQLTDRPAAPAAPVSSAPTYPTSSRTGAKDWDKLASSLTAKKSKEKKGESATSTQNETGDASDAESVDSDLGGDAVDGFFKKLYAGADPDTRRAMMKSYIESQGTSLSTNWSEVGHKKVEPHPPS
ncbi:hypothetical protein N7539_000321 [Penicillium diatomitis]|uniref:SGT1 and CS domain protein n=1 Tax=Penicillium diatomitis TaxID=2819901 RepID=A0A9X0C2J1_9EURO|nr:uncharacterized protein N7539_000321 [Penicillium diatomitis]KAJ5495205.1 hypothetical protein N7539_000321 [Penicillium diatomitis]